METTTVRRAVTVMAFAAAIGSTVSVGTATAQVAPAYEGCGVLLEGQSGPCIVRLQDDLKALNESLDFDSTGFFGEQTRIAVLDFQGRNGLDADGNAGPEVQGELIRQTGGTSSIDEETPETPETSEESEESEESGDSAQEPPEFEIRDGQRCEVVDPSSTVYAERYGVTEFAGMKDYLTGAVPPPRCFPYTPKVEDTEAGTRALDPFTDGCSGPTWDDAGPFWDRRDACATHDYAYDLLRFGVDTFREPTADGQLVDDMIEDCEDSGVMYPTCVAHAYAWRPPVGWRGNVEPGDTISDH